MTITGHFFIDFLSVIDSQDVVIWTLFSAIACSQLYGISRILKGKIDLLKP